MEPHSGGSHCDDNEGATQRCQALRRAGPAPRQCTAAHRQGQRCRRVATAAVQQAALGPSRHRAACSSRAAQHQTIPKPCKHRRQPQPHVRFCSCGAQWHSSRLHTPSMRCSVCSEAPGPLPTRAQDQTKLPAVRATLRQQHSHSHLAHSPSYHAR